MTQTVEPQTGPLPSNGTAREPVKRPGAVTIVGVLAIVIATLSLILAVLDIFVIVVYLRELPPSSQVLSEQQAEALAVGIVLLITSLPMLVTAVALLRMHRWAWSVLMTLVVIGLAGGLGGHFYGRDTYVEMLLYTVLAFAMNRAVIQEAFGIRRAVP